MYDGQRNKYHNISCWEEERTVDQLLKDYGQDKTMILDLLVKNPNELVQMMWSENSPLSYDNTCRVNMGKGNIKSCFACINCVNMKHLVDFSKYKMNDCFNILTGNHVGTSMMLTEIKVDGVYLDYDVNKNIKGDDFTIRTLITWYIESIFNKKKLPHALLLHTAYICGNTGYSLYTAPTINNEICHFNTIITSLNKNDKKTNIEAYGILMQVIVIFSELKAINLIHNNPICTSLLFDKKPCSYKYNILNKGSIHVLCGNTVFLADLLKASAQINDVYLYSQQDNMKCSNVSVAKCVQTTSGLSNKQYKIKNDYFDMYLNMVKSNNKHLPSIDLYIMLLSMMLNTDFFNIVVNDDKCNRLWKSLWDNQENIIETRLKEFVTQNLPIKKDTLLILLKDVWLYDDLSSILLQTLC